VTGPVIRLQGQTDDDDAVSSEVETCSILYPDLRSLAMQIDGIESWSENEIPESRLVPGFAEKIMTPVTLLFKWGEVEALKLDQPRSPSFKNSPMDYVLMR
jgi:hypothetical protein